MSIVISVKADMIAAYNIAQNTTLKIRCDKTMSLKQLSNALKIAQQHIKVIPHHATVRMIELTVEPCVYLLLFPLKFSHFKVVECAY